MNSLCGQQQGPVGRMASRPAVTRPAMRVAPWPNAADRPLIPALDISSSIPPPWFVEPSSSQTIGREYKELKVVEWAMTEAERAEIMDYLRSKLGDVMLKDPRQYLDPFIARIWNEASTNRAFMMAFCMPVQEILDAYFCRVNNNKNRQVIFYERVQGSRADGIPDFVFQIWKMQHQGGKTTKPFDPKACDDLVIGEGKTPSVMRSIPRVVAQELEQDAAASCMQACDYVRQRCMRYGFLTYLDGTFFIKRLGKDVYAFTDALPPDAKNPTIMEMLLYIVLKQHEEGLWCETSEGDPSAAQIIQQATPLIVRHREKSSGSSSTSSWITAQSHPEDALVFEGKILGYGLTGNTVLARYYGQPAAIKSLDLSKQDYLVELLQHEVEMYEHLQDLQGVCIPQLLGHGLWHNDTTYFIATSLIEGDHPSCEGTPPQVLMVIEQALCSIHNHGVLHDDVRAENILLVADGAGGVQAFFIDFGNSIRCDDSFKHAQEVAQLRQLLGCSA